jgi:hypothetical protein
MNRAISKSCGECTLRDAIDSGRTGMSKANYHFRFSSEPALSLRGARLARIPTNRTSIWMMKPGCLLTAAATTGARGDGGEIFSNEKTGMVYPPPRRVETLPDVLRYLERTTCHTKSFSPV